MSENFDRYTDLFLEEASEQIEELNQNLLDLERVGYDPEIINEIFRTAHTLKSSAAFVGLEDLSELAHRMEDLLQEVKDEKVEVTTELVNVFFQCLDRIKVAVAQVSEGQFPEDTFADLIENLNEYSKRHSHAPPSKKDAPTSKSSKSASVKKEPKNEAAPETEKKEEQEEETTDSDDDLDVITTDPLELSEHDEEILSVAAKDKQNVFDGIILIDPDARMKNMRLLLLLQNLKRIGEVFTSDPLEEDLEGDEVYESMKFIYFGDAEKDLVVSACQVDSVEEITIIEHEKKVKESKKAGKTEKKKDTRMKDETHVKTKSIKVSSEKIDYLLNSVGELVITNSGLLKIYEDLHEELGDAGLLSELKTKIDQAARIARDLQSGIMKTRMIPVELVFQRFTRPVRDLALELSKDVLLEFQGEDTELDKNIIDALNDPLLHLVRNSLDHGIEAPDEREKQGKPRTGKLLLNAFQSGNNIFVEVRDDGKGLNRDRIFSKAVEKGLIPPDSTLPDDEVYNLIFHPGFSTAPKVTDVSGRGVGMSVVKNMVQEFKGNVTIQNHPGQGTAFVLSFPLTLAIISAILVKVDMEEYAFPLSDVVETIKVNRDDITTLQGKDIINLRGDILPVFQLGELMGQPALSLSSRDEFPVVIANVNNRKVGFIVDMMVGKQEIVIKSLEQNFRTVDGLIGACLMGDGSIVMVLDVQGLLELAQIPSDERRYGDETPEGVMTATKRFNEMTDQLSGVSRRGFQKKLKNVKKDDEKGIKKPSEREVEEPQPVETALPVGSESGALSSVEEITEVSQPLSEVTPPVAAITTENPSMDLDETSGSSTKEQELHPELHTSVVTIARENNTQQEPDDVVSNAITSLADEKQERKDRAQNILSKTEERAKTRELTEEEYSRLYSVINTGMINAGFVLSQLLGVTVEVSVPEFKTIELDELLTYIPEDKIIAVNLNTTGDFRALVSLVFDEVNGKRASADLMGVTSGDDQAKLSDEDVKSVLSELTNIVGSSILNALANKTGVEIHPTVPAYHDGSSKDLLKDINSRYSQEDVLKVIYISADFYRDDMELLGKVFLLPTKDSLSMLAGKL